VNEADFYPEWVTRELAPGETTVRLLTAVEVAPMFRVARSTIQTWIRQGQMQAIRTPGHELRIPHTEVRRVLRVLAEREELTGHVS
jgi:excisionase family DNA binding protein